MSKSSALLQEVDTPEVITPEVTTTEVVTPNPEQIVDTTKDANGCIIGEEVWDPAKKMCMPVTEQVDLGVEEEVVTSDAEEEVVTSDVEEESVKQHDNFLSLIESAVDENEKLKNVNIFNKDTDEGFYFFNNLQNVVNDFKIAYPKYEITTNDIALYATLNKQVLNEVFESEPDVDVIANVYFSEITDVLESRSYANAFKGNAGDADFDFNKWYNQYGACSLDTKRQCQDYYAKYISYKNRGTFDMSNVSSDQMEIAKEEYYDKSRDAILLGLQEEQKELMSLLDGQGSIVRYSTWLGKVDVNIPKADIVTEKYNKLKSKKGHANGYLDVASVTSFDLNELRQSVSESKVENMIKNTWSYINFGDGDKDYKITPQIAGGDVLLIQGPTSPVGGRLTMKLDLDSIVSNNSEESDEWNEMKTKENWKKAVSDIMTFFVKDDIERAENIIYMSGGEWNGLTLAEVQREEKKRILTQKRVISSQVPTTSDIINDAYNYDGEQVFTYEKGEQDYVNPLNGDVSYSVPVYYRKNALTGEVTVIKDKELLADLFASHWLLKKQELTSNPLHDALYPITLDSEMSIDSYAKQAGNNIFIKRASSDGTFVAYDSSTVAKSLSQIYPNFTFTAGSAGEINISDTKTGAQTTLSYRQEGGGYAQNMEFNVNSIEAFKYNLVVFLEKHIDGYSGNLNVVKKEKRQEVYEHFYGDNGEFLRLNEEQLEELEKFNTPEFSSSLLSQVSSSRETGFGQSGDAYLYSDSDNEYADQLNLAVKVLTTQMNVKNPTKEMVVAVAQEIILKEFKNKNIEKNIGDWWKNVSDEELIRVFGSKDKDHLKNLMVLAGNDKTSAVERSVYEITGKITTYETLFQNGPDRKTFNSFMEVLNGPDLFMEKVTQEDIDEQRVVGVRTSDGGVKYVPVDVYKDFQLASIGLQTQLYTISVLRDQVADQLEGIKDIPLYLDLVSKSYSWGDYMGTNVLGGLMAGYVKATGAFINGDNAGANEWLGIYSDIKAYKSGVSQEAARFNVDDMGLNPLGYFGFAFELIAEQTESFSAFALGMAIAGGSPIGVGIGASLVGFSSYSGNYMDAQIQYVQKNGSLDNFDEDSSQFYQSLAIGAVNFVSAYVSGKFLNQSYNFFKNAIPSGAQKIIWYEGLRNYAALNLPLGTLDATVEALTEISENLIKGEKVDWDLAKDVFFETGLFNLLLPTAGGGMSAIMQYTNKFDENSTVRKNLKRIDEINIRLKEITRRFDYTKNKGSEFDVLTKEMDGLLQENMLEMKAAYEKMGKLDKGMLFFLAKIDGDQRRIEMQIEEIKKDSSKSIREKQDAINKLEETYRDNKKTIDGFFNDDSIKNKFAVLSDKAKNNSNDKATLDRILKAAVAKLKADGNEDPLQADIDAVASILYNQEVVTKNHEKNQEVLKKYNPKMASRKKLSQTVDDGVKDASDLYDAELERLAGLPPESTITVKGKKYTVAAVIEAVKRNKKETIDGIKNGNHGVNIDFTDQGGAKNSITIVENSAADDRTENQTHEDGHDVFIEMIGGDTKTYKALSDVVQSYLKQNYSNLWLLINNTVERDSNGDMVNDEVVMRFLELVSSEQIKLDFNKKNDSIFSSFFAYFASEAVEAQTGLEFNFDIKGAEGAIHFLKTLAMKLKTGEITPEDVQAAKNSNLIKNIVSNVEQNVLDMDFFKMSSSTQAGVVNDIYEQEGEAGIPKILDEYGGMARIAADKYANIPGIDYDILSGFRTDILYHPRGVIGLIMEYNPKSADYEISVNGVKQTVTVTYNKNGDVRVNKEKVPELKDFTDEQMQDYITREFGSITDINQVPLSGYINLYLGRRVIDIAKDNVSVRDAIAGITVEQGDTDMMSDIADDNTGADELYDENNENIEEKTGEVRKILNIEKGGVVYNKVINTVKETLPKLTTDKALANPKNQKKYRQALEKEFTKQLMSDLNAIFNDRTKFDAFLRKHQDAITKLIAIKYKNKFPFLTYDDGRMDTEQMQDPDNLATGDKGAGNQIWKIKDLTPDQFVALFTVGDGTASGRRNAWETQRKSLQKSLAAELGLDAVFTALPPSLESKVGKLAEALKRDPNTKFSVAGQTFDFKTFEVKNSDGTGAGIIDTQKLGGEIRALALRFKQEDFLKYFDEETMTLEGYDYDPAVVAYVYHNAHNPELDATSQYFIKDLVAKNPNLQNNPQVDEFLNQGAFKNNKEAQKKQVKEVTAVVTKYMNGGIYIALKGNGIGFYSRALNASKTVHDPRGERQDGRKMTGNNSHSGKTPLLVEGWKFDYDAKIEINGVTYTGAFVGMVDGKKVTSIDPVGDPSIKAKLISGPHYNSKQNIQNNLDMEFVSDINIAFQDIRIMNKDIKGGIMDRLDKIMYGSIEEYGEYNTPERLANQKAALALMMPEIERANKANVDAAVGMNIAWFDAIIGGDASITGLLRYLQLQTGDVKGPRGLSTIIGVSFPLGPKTGKNQGEHMVVTAETSGDIADLAGRAFLLDENGVVVGYKPGFDRSIVKAELYKIMNNNAQILVPHEFSKTMDKGPGGNTSNARLNRINFLDPSQRETVIGMDGLPFVNTQINIAILNDINNETVVIQEENTQEQQTALSLNAIYTKNSQGTVSKSMIADFDETMWTGGDNVIVATNPTTGETVDIASEDFHKVVKHYEKNGWTFNFDDFVNVEGGQRGPYWDRAVRFIKEEGLDNFRVLTARQPEAAIAIAHTLHYELIEDGVVNPATKKPYTVEEIVLKVTGLGAGGITVTGKMKADWAFNNIVSNGYTKVEFADDGLENVEEMQLMFDDLPVGTVEGTSLLVTEEFKDTHEKFSKKTNSETFNIFIEETSGVDKNKVYSRYRAKQDGRKTGTINNLVPYSAEDFKGLLYQFLGEGEMGEYQMAWFTEKLIKPYSRAESNATKQARKIDAQYANLVKNIKGINEKLKTGIRRANGTKTYFSKDMAVRVYLWDKNGIDIPGLSKRDRKLLIDTVQADQELMTVANQVSAISNLPEGYVQPSASWESGTISDDLQRVRLMEARKTHMEEFQQNADEIFSEENLNKIEAIHGTKYRQALENMLARMKTGRSDGGATRDKDPIIQKWDEWVNNSVGAIMFLNGRSAVLQTLSTFNYVKINGPNNMANAAAAFSNQPQFWTDFLELWNSEYLVSRRDGEKRGINENELAKAVKQGGARGAVAYLLKLGFTPTKLADSFAIASGGATYVRNYTNSIADMLLDFQSSDVDIETLFEAQDVFTKDELNTYLGDRDINDLTEEEVQDLAKKIALEKWEMETETGQQSSRQDMLSQEQTGGLGRLILAFKNTPMQYTRKITRALQDLKNNRGNPAEHIANIAYYGGVQSLMFNGLQQALFARLDDDDEDWNDATDKVVQGMVDSYIQGMGLTGAVVVTVKNGVLEFKEQDKKGWNADHTYTVLEFANISPTIGSKLRKLYGSIKGRQLNKDVIAEMDLWDPQNPAWSAVANIIEAFTNIPAADVVNKMNNLLAISKDENEWWQNLSLLLGWNTWDVGVETKAKKLREELKNTKKQEKKVEAKVVAQQKVDVVVEQEVIKEKKGEGTDVNTCAGVGSDGQRCKIKVDKAGGRCQYHASADEKAKMQKCGYIYDKGPKKGKGCGNFAVNDAGRCNVPQHQP